MISDIIFRRNVSVLEKDYDVDTSQPSLQRRCLLPNNVTLN